jgi:hypothetical protein
LSAEINAIIGKSLTGELDERNHFYGKRVT